MDFLRKPSFPFAFAAAFTAANCFAQLRIVSYNVGEWTTARGALAESNHGTGNLDDIFTAIANESRAGIAQAPDVIAIQEMTSTGTTGANVVSALNAVFGSGTYVVDPFNVGTNGNGRPGLIYNTQTVQVIGRQSVGTLSTSGAARITARHQLRPVGYDSSADFYLYNSHFKASTGEVNEDRRDEEAMDIRGNADSLGQGAHIIYAGDLNLYTSNEPAYQTFLGSGNGQAFDPIDRPGNWNASFSFRDVHTQSPVSSTGERYVGQVGGGLDSRFDFQLTTGEFLDNEGLSYIGGTYRAFGNNGTSYNTDIDSGSGASSLALNALMNTSDHIPVVADYQLPAIMQVDVDLAGLPTTVIRGATVNVPVEVSNVAPVSTINGADELDWSASGSGALVGATSGSDAALGGGDSFSIGFDTSTVGSLSGTVSVNSSSQQVQDGSFSQMVSLDVLEPAHPSFSDSIDQTTLTIDFGDVYQDTTTLLQDFDIFNREAVIGDTATMNFTGVSSSGDTSNLIQTLFFAPPTAAGDSLSGQAVFSTTTAGEFAATYEFSFTEGAILGASTQTIALELSGTVLARLPGDYNFDGEVDAADYTVWRDTLGSTVALAGGGADGNGDGMITQLDYNVWRSNFGAVAGGSLGVGVVPEPGSIVLGLGLAVTAWRSQRRRGKLAA